MADTPQSKSRWLFARHMRLQQGIQDEIRERWGEEGNAPIPEIRQWMIDYLVDRTRHIQYPTLVEYGFTQSESDRLDMVEHSFPDSQHEDDYGRMQNMVWDVPLVHGSRLDDYPSNRWTTFGTSGVPLYVADMESDDRLVDNAQ